MPFSDWLYSSFYWHSGLPERLDRFGIRRISYRSCTDIRKLLMQAIPRALVIGLSIFLFLAMAQRTDAAETQIGNRHVYGLWENIDSSLLTIAQILSGADPWHEDVAALSPQNFQGTTIDKVFEEIEAFQLGAADLLAISNEKMDTLESVAQNGVDLPSVLLLSNDLLALQINWIVENAGHRLPIAGMMSRKPADALSKDVTLDELFAMIDLTNRRLELINARANR